MLKKSLLSSLVLLCSSAVMSAEMVEFQAGDGRLSIKKVDSSGIYSTYEFSYNGDVFAKKESIDLEVKYLGNVDGTDYSIIKSVIGGSGCAEEVTVLTAENDYFVFSPSIPACGGFRGAKLNRGDVLVKTFERDEVTKNSYRVHGSMVSVRSKKGDYSSELITDD